MDNLEESLREVCCIGDLEKMKVLLHNGVNINSQNKINGWSALHWAAKRNHTDIVSCLLENGADPSISTDNGELAVDLTKSKVIKRMLSNNKEDIEGIGEPEDLPPTKFIPNYMLNPDFPYSESPAEFARRLGIHHQITGEPAKSKQQKDAKDEEPNLVVKLRIAEGEEKDFIEVELDKKCLNFTALVDVCLTEFDIEKDKLDKIRKLPNTIVRNDKDVKRLKHFQEIELVLKK